MFCLASVGFTSCSDDEELTDSKITYYPEMEIQGDEFTILPIGTPYVDKGCKGTLQGEDCTSSLITEGVEDVDYNTAGLYYVTYSHINKDGYLKSVKEQLLSVTLPLRLILRVNIRFKAEVIEIMDRHKRSMPSILSL